MAGVRTRIGDFSVPWQKIFPRQHCLLDLVHADRRVDGGDCVAFSRKMKRFFQHFFSVVVIVEKLKFKTFKRGSFERRWSDRSGSVSESFFQLSKVMTKEQNVFLFDSPLCWVEQKERKEKYDFLFYFDLSIFCLIYCHRSKLHHKQCDQIWRFIGLWATF